MFFVVVCNKTKETSSVTVSRVVPADLKKCGDKIVAEEAQRIESKTFFPRHKNNDTLIKLDI